MAKKMVLLFHMRYALTIIALASIIFLLGFGSFAMATMTDHANGCPVAIANGFSCFNAVSIADHLTAIQQLLQAIVQNISIVMLAGFAMVLIVSIPNLTISPPIAHPAVLRSRAAAVSLSRLQVYVWQNRLSHSPTVA